MAAIPVNHHTYNLNHRGSFQQIDSIMNADPRFFRVGSWLPLHETLIWKIKVGVVRSLTSTEDGSLVTLGVWGQGDILGSCISPTNPYSLQCLTDVKAYALDTRIWPQKEEDLIQHIRHLQEYSLLKKSHKVYPALIDLLNWLSLRFGIKTGQGRLIQFRLTHQLISELLGSTRVTITRTLADLEQKKIIQRLPGHKIIVCDRFFERFID